MWEIKPILRVKDGSLAGKVPIAKPFGSVIELGNSGFKLDPADFKSLEKYPGQTLITTDGTTLLGADDKSGIAEIMTAIEYLTAHPEIKHCEIRVGFGPDEEIRCWCLINLMQKILMLILPNTVDGRTTR